MQKTEFKIINRVVLNDQYDFVLGERTEPKVPYVLTIWDKKIDCYWWDMEGKNKGIACTDMLSAQAIFQRVGAFFSFVVAKIL